jgi:hypothetical protein
VPGDDATTATSSLGFKYDFVSDTKLPVEDDSWQLEYDLGLFPT